MTITHCRHYVLRLPEAESNANQTLYIWWHTPKGQQYCLLIWTSSHHRLSNGSDRAKSVGAPDLQQSGRLANTHHGIWNRCSQSIRKQDVTELPCIWTWYQHWLLRLYCHLLATLCTADKILSMAICRSCMHLSFHRYIVYTHTRTHTRTHAHTYSASLRSCCTFFTDKHNRHSEFRQKYWLFPANIITFGNNWNQLCHKTWL